MKQKPAPAIHPGMEIPKTPQPFIGKNRFLIFSVISAVLKTQIKRGATDKIFISAEGGLVIQIAGDDLSGDPISEGGAVMRYRGQWSSTVTNYIVGNVVDEGPGVNSGRYVAVGIPAIGEEPWNSSNWVQSPQSFGPWT